MYFDSLTLAAITDELQATILGGRVQRVLLPNAWSIGLEVYAHHQRYQLFASAHPNYARVHLVRQKLSRGVEQATPLLLLLRKYALGGRITALEQPPLERVLIVSIVKERKTCNHEGESEALDIASQPSDEASETLEMRSCELCIEIMGRHSNIVLVDADNLILESVKRVTPQMSRRVILPRYAYELPPRQEKRDPTQALPADLENLPTADDRTLERRLVAEYRGVSPQIAREVIFRARYAASDGTTEGGDQESPEPRAVFSTTLATCLRDIFVPPWQPVLVAGSDYPHAYAAYQLIHMKGAISQESMSAAVEAFSARHEQVTSHRQRREEVQASLEECRKRLHHRHKQLVSEMEHSKKLDQMRWEGDMIYAFLHTIVPGQTVLEVEGQQIALDPDLSPVEAAQKRFQAYNKAKSGLSSIASRLGETEHQMAGLEQLMVLLDLTDEREQIEQIAREAEEQGYMAVERRAADAKKRKRSSGKRAKPLHLVSGEGFDIYVGRSNDQNAEVTFRIGRPDDLWLHVRGVPGAHVIIRTAGREVPEQTLREAAGLAAYFSRARSEAMVDVDVSRRSRVRKVPGGPPGLVTYHAEQTLHVVPCPPWC